MKNLTRIMTFTFLAACLFILGACSSDSDSDSPFEEKLVGKWSNGLTGSDKRSFEIFKDGNFTAELNPMGQGTGTVTGKLVSEGNNNYIINDMKTTGQTNWAIDPGFFNGEAVNIDISQTGDSFMMNSANPLVFQFFGGNYFKQ